MMPPWTFQSPRNEERAAAIGAELLKLDFDVLCLQKAFPGRARDVLRGVLGHHYPYEYGPANPANFLIQNSGVWVLSRLPLSNYEEIEFRERSGIEVFARKGAMFLGGAFGNHPFQLVATHLQGDDTPQYRREHQVIRNHQMEQIRPRIDRASCSDRRPRLPVWRFLNAPA